MSAAPDLRLVPAGVAPPDGSATPDPWADRDLPDSSEIPVIAEALGIPADRVTWLIAVAKRREARYAAVFRGQAADSFGDDYADPEFQAERAFWALYESKTNFPRLPWRAADAITGPLVPGMLVIVGARTGNGKTTLLLNLLDRWVEIGRSLCYLGLEQTPQELRTKWACLRAGVPPEVALAHDGSRIRGTVAEALDRVAAEMAWQASPAARRRARFAPTKYVTAAKLAQVAQWAAGEGCQVLVVDHVDRIDHGDGKNAFAEMSRTIRLAKELAVEHKLVVLLASQAKRPSDKLERFMPLEASELRGGGTKEEEADIILTTYRPLQPGVTTKQLRAVRQGLASEDTVITNGTMGLKNLKARLIDAHLGKTASLRVDHGRVTDIEPPAGPLPVDHQHYTRRDDDEPVTHARGAAGRGAGGRDA